MTQTSIYVHVPFCRHRCAYCDFNTYAGMMHLIPDYVEALIREIRYHNILPEDYLDIHTIYFGGGTPSLLGASDYEKILTALGDRYRFLPDIEITVEGNPESLSESYLRALYNLGINRLSLGVQSADPEILRFLERQHSFDDVSNVCEWARRAGFENISLDLIFGIPNQEASSWDESLRQGLRLAPEHFSLYALSLEAGTPMYLWEETGLITTPDPDTAADMYETAGQMLREAGYWQYEISNWARSSDAEVRLDEDGTQNPSYASRHNLQYWRNEPYLGFGAGAHGYANGSRTSNTLRIQDYISRLDPTRVQERRPVFPATPGASSVEKIERHREIGETMMMGLRLTREGIDDRTFRARFSASMVDIYSAEIRKFEKWGLLMWCDGHLRLTPNGYLLGNQVFQAFV